MLRIGTRGSPLALAQAYATRDLLRAAWPELFSRESSIEIVVVQTTGDAVLSRPLADVGGKGLFTRELDDALLAGKIHVAVHSMKDVPTWLADGTCLPAILAREDPRDVLVRGPGAVGGAGPASSEPDALRNAILTLPSGATVGTSSLRRGSQVLALRPDLRVVSLRGNVQTRVRKLRDGVCDATLLALAGLRRLGVDRLLIREEDGCGPSSADPAEPVAAESSSAAPGTLAGGVPRPEAPTRIDASLFESLPSAAVLPPSVLLPAVAQGAVGVAAREDDELVLRLLEPLNHTETAVQIACERAFLAELDGSCRTPIAGICEISEGGKDAPENAALFFRGLVARPDGAEVARVEGGLGGGATMQNAVELGTQLAQQLRSGARKGFFDW